MKTVWVAVGLLGLIGGFMLTSLMYMVYLASADSNPMPLLAFIIGLLGAVIGSGISLKYQSKSVLFFTSFIGAYFLARGLSYIIPSGLPSFTSLYTSEAA